MMRSKSLITLSAALALAAFGQAAQACAISAWSSATGVTQAANTGEPAAGFARYSGRCSFKTTAGSQFVQDNSPGSASSYKARMYVKADAGSAGNVFKARNAAGTAIITIAKSGTTFTFNVNGAATQPAPVTIIEGRWYSIEMDWAAGAAATFKVKGAGQTVATSPAAVTSGAAPAGDLIANVQMGNTEAAGTGTMSFDEFDSRRTTAPGRLCRGDANGNSAGNPAGVLTGGDAQAIFNEVGTGGLSPGQPDFNENGTVTGGDAQAIFNAVGTGVNQCNVL
jgi:hypothetical protein